MYQKYGRKVYNFLLSLSGSEALAEELLQETFFQAFQHINQFEGRCSIYTWLCQIGKNAWLKEIKRKKRYSEISIEDLHLPDNLPLLEEQIIQKEQYLRTRKAMLALEEPYKNVFILHAISDIKLKEIANLYGKTESWARVTYYRARMQIIEEVMK
ncbi:MAG: sigma-70 family RNA polymerase sigma factor [Lachnospiraceae bacterium]|nr:sigma-70 family RNA polymerase sigma factor [Lachnospiraceae bacterium]